MQSLNDSQLLLLSTIVYCFGREAEVELGETLGTLVMDCDTGLKRRMQKEDAKMDGHVAEAMNFWQWFATMDAIRRDEMLSSLRVDAFSHDELNAKIICLSDDENNAYLVYSGSGSGEWKDNCAGAYLVETPQQLRALAFFDEQVAPKGYASITVCGHSKGGNKSQYVTVLRGEQIDRAVSFDGQGFSLQFLDAYEQQIAAHEDKILAYALDNDYVNSMLNPIASKDQYHYINSGKEDAFQYYHAPFAMFRLQEEGETTLELDKFVPQGDVGHVAVQLTEYLQVEVPEDDYRRVVDCFGVIADGIKAKRSTAERALLFSDVYTNEDFSLSVGYLVEFFQGIGRNVTAMDIIKFLIPDEDQSQDEDKNVIEHVAEWLQQRPEGSWLDRLADIPLMQLPEKLLEKLR